jgi:hypothetical protein
MAACSRRDAKDTFVAEADDGEVVPHGVERREETEMRVGAARAPDQCGEATPRKP